MIVYVAHQGISHSSAITQIGSSKEAPKPLFQYVGKYGTEARSSATAIRNPLRADTRTPELFLDRTPRLLYGPNQRMERRDVISGAAFSLR